MPLDCAVLLYCCLLMQFSRAQRRRQIRLPGYDYATPGAYFVTLCTEKRACLFGAVVDGKIHLHEAGQIVRIEWRRSAEIRCESSLDEFVVMPNHIHGIIFIQAGEGTSMTDVVVGGVGATGRSPLQHRPIGPSPVPQARPGPLPRSLGAFIGGFKSAATMRINALRGTPGIPVGQRNYYEHVIRDESELQRIREYIRQNPFAMGGRPRESRSHNTKPAGTLGTASPVILDVGATGRSPLRPPVAGSSALRTAAELTSARARSDRVRPSAPNAR